MLINFVVGIISVVMLSKVKKAYQNKMGSYQELAYYFTQSRSLILVISFQVSLSLLVTSGYCFFFVTRFICDFYDALVQENENKVS